MSVKLLNYFEWRHDVAAEEHRLSQARNFIRDVVIHPAPIEPLARALFELEQMQARYAHLVELAEVWAAAGRARRRAA